MKDWKNKNENFKIEGIIIRTKKREDKGKRENLSGNGSINAGK